MSLFTRAELLSSPECWFEEAQNELFRQVTDYMEKTGINQTQLAEKLGVTKGYVSQIVNGNFNYTLKKLIQLSLAIGMVPQIQYKPVDQVIKEDELYWITYEAAKAKKAKRVVASSKRTKRRSKA